MDWTRILGKSKYVAPAVAGASVVMSPEEAEAMYVGPKAAGWSALTNKFSSLMDRMPRAEISDVGAKVDLSERGYKLKDLLDHPALYEQYPDLQDIRAVLSPGKDAGVYMAPNRHEKAGSITVGYTDPSQVKPTLLHEIQHAIQEKEGWAKGGQPSEFNKGWNVSEDQRKAWRDEVFNKYRVVELFERADKAGITPQQALAQESKSWGMDTGNARIKELLGAYKNKDEARAMWLESKKQLDDYTQRTIMDPSEQYRKLSGEIESRDTAARMGLTAAQRASTAPYAGQGIPLKDTITKMGVAAPVGAVLAEQLANKRAMAQKYEGGGLQDAVNPVEYMIPARVGGGLLNMGADAVMRYWQSIMNR